MVHQFDVYTKKQVSDFKTTLLLPYLYNFKAYEYARGIELRTDCQGHRLY